MLVKLIFLKIIAFEIWNLLNYEIVLFELFDLSHWHFISCSHARVFLMMYIWVITDDLSTKSTSI
jgi:hypothetical protein